MSVTIPAGVNDGATMQIQGEGNFDKKRCIHGSNLCVHQILHVYSLHLDLRKGSTSALSVSYGWTLLKS